MKTAQYRFKFNRVNVETVTRITKIVTKKINKSQICNSLVWRDSMEYTAYHITQIINESFTTGTFPENLKTTTITPIPKIKNTKKRMNSDP